MSLHAFRQSIGTCATRLQTRPEYRLHTPNSRGWSHHFQALAHLIQPIFRDVFILSEYLHGPIHEILSLIRDVVVAHFAQELVSSRLHRLRAPSAVPAAHFVDTQLLDARLVEVPHRAKAVRALDDLFGKAILGNLLLAIAHDR
jgi:hypothetical protein